jgi:hypothetical protein
VIKTAWVLIFVGLSSLLLLIPYLGLRFKNSDVKTEFLSTRGAYWCVVTGLVLFTINALGLEIIKAVAALRGK